MIPLSDCNESNKEASKEHLGLSALGDSEDHQLRSASRLSQNSPDSILKNRRSSRLSNTLQADGRMKQTNPFARPTNSKLNIGHIFTPNQPESHAMQIEEHHADREESGRSSFLNPPLIKQT